MNATSHQLQRHPLSRHAGTWVKDARFFLFPLATNFWPALLFVSQKVFVFPAILLNGFGDKKYRYDMLLALSAILVGALVLMTQIPNSYSEIHFAGYAIFVLSMPAINRAVRHDPQKLRMYLTYFTLLNVAMGLYLSIYEVDLYGLRGLNRVVNRYGVTNRVYFESSSLAAVVAITAFRKKWLQAAIFVAVVTFVVFVAKSVAVVLLLGANLAFPYIMRSTAVVKVGVAITIAAALVVLYIYLPVLRPDVNLSLQAKQFQFDLIVGSLGDGWSGWGWGAFYPELATDIEQPYQVEMQAPMLLLQLGPAAALVIAASFLAMFMSAADKRWKSLVRFAVYVLIGLNNPWLFIPSWYLTCQLLLRYDEKDTRDGTVIDATSYRVAHD